MRKDIHIIFNQSAGGGKAGKMWPAIRTALNKLPDLVILLPI